MGSNDLGLPQHLLARMMSPADINFLGRGDILSLLKDAQRWSIDPEDATCIQRLFTVIEEHLGYALFREIERTKIGLGITPEFTFHFEAPDILVEEVVYSDDFRAFTHDLVEKILAYMDTVIASAGIRVTAIDAVFATGGTAKLQAIAHGLAGRFDKSRINQFRNFHSVVNGLARVGSTQFQSH